jgi:uncharacterized membrane protein (UPF0127 family)
VTERAHFLQPLVGTDIRGMTLTVAGRNGIVADQIETAFDSRSRTRGLLGRKGLPLGAALIIAPSNAIHTFRMQFAIDVIYAARDGTVVKLRRGLRPWRMSAALQAFAVIELAAGAIDRANLHVGERLIVTTSRGETPPSR